MPQVKQANNTSVPSADSVNYWITLIFFRGQQRTNSLLARISALRNGPREGAGYKSLSNISIFFLFYTAASRTRSNWGKKKSAINFVFSNRTACKFCRAGMACHKHTSTFETCAQWTRVLYTGQVGVSEPVASFHLALFPKHLCTAANSLSDLRCCDPGIPEHSLQRRTFSYIGKCYNFGHPV